AALSPDVFSVGSMSKPIWGGLRAGWIRTDAETVTRLAIVRARADMSGSVLDQLLACELFADYPQIIADRRAELRAGRDALLTALAERLPGWRPSRPAGGLSSWIRLDAPASSALTHQAEQRGVLLTPGSRFTVEASLERYLRIPFALPPAVLSDAIGRIALAWAELDGQPVRRFEAGLLVPT
ncbi:MAG: aminotransferase class I/II-fold pyridoxal phosphate-dependent enzyme, partial [Jatrophihabitantaceae bacterium]